jgi:hypothetical protein
VKLSLILVVSASFVACGGSAGKWMPQDTTNVTEIDKASVSLEVMCDRDGGVCDPRTIRSVQSGICKVAASMLYRHEQPIPDGGGAFGCGGP